MENNDFDAIIELKKTQQAVIPKINDEEALLSLLNVWANRTHTLCNALVAYDTTHGLSNLPPETISALQPIWATIRASAMNCGHVLPLLELK